MKYIYCERCDEAFPAPALGSEKCSRCGAEGHPVSVRRSRYGLITHLLFGGIMLLIIVHYVSAVPDLFLAPMGIILAGLALYSSAMDNRKMKAAARQKAAELLGR